MSILKLTDISLRRFGTQILQDISWKVEQREHWVLLGANGSGKTSLLSILCGLATPSSGRLELLGRVFGEDDWGELRQRIGLVGSAVRQRIEEAETGLEVLLSGFFGQINLWGVKPTKAQKEAARAWAAQMGLEPLLERSWAVFSQGERQKLLVGRALLAKPELLVLDEACAGLDPIAREAFLTFVAENLKNISGPPTVLQVTHHVEEILPEFTHVLGLREGRIAFHGPLRAQLTSQNLSSLFSAPLTLRGQQGRYSLTIP